MANGKIPLHSAIRAYEDGLSVVKFLLKEHPDDVNTANSEGETALHLAARNAKCHPEVIQLLLEHGADVKKKSVNDGNTALHYFAMSNGTHNKIVIDLLLKHGSDVDTYNSEGDTPLHLAARNESVNAPDLELLELASDVNAKNFNGDTPLHFYLQNKTLTRYFVRTSRFVRKCGDVNLTNSNGETPLHLAARNAQCYPEVIKLLLEHGADVKAMTSRDGNTALHYVAMSNNISSFSAAKILLKHGSPVDIGNLEGDTPLHLAARNVGVNVPLLELLEHVRDVNVMKNCRRDTPLHLHLQNKTLMSSFLRTVKFARKCSDINFTNCCGETPLHLVVRNEGFYSCFAIPYCQISLIQFLISQGVHSGKEDVMGHTAYQAYCETVDENNGIRDPMLEIILQPNELQERMKTSLHVACLFHDVESVHNLLRLGADVNATDNFGYSPLFYALIAHAVTADKLADKCSTVKLLLDYGADINHQFTRSTLSLSTLVFNGIADMDAEDYQAMRSTFLKHTAKLMALRENPVVEGMRRYNVYYFPTPEEIGADNIDSFNNWRSTCAEELKSMSQTEIGENTVTFLDLLFASAEDTAVFAKNKELVEAFRVKKDMFPMYEGMLDAKLARDLEHLKLVKSAIAVLRNVLKLTDPSDELFERSLADFSNEDLMRIIDGTGEIEEKLPWLSM